MTMSLPYWSAVSSKRSDASEPAVISTMETCCVQAPLLPGLRPSFCDSAVRYSMVLRSPAVPGLRPSNSSLASVAT